LSVNPATAKAWSKAYSPCPIPRASRSPPRSTTLPAAAPFRSRSKAPPISRYQRQLPIPTSNPSFAPKGGGGIQPDYVVYPEAPTRLRAVLDATATFTTFAIEYVKNHPDIPKNFEVTPAILSDFELFCSQRNIQPGVGDWSRERPFIENRLKTEIFNQAFGIEKGDEVEAQRDAQILKALEVISAK
jgi:carboxyl-terminal processing protease